MRRTSEREGIAPLQAGGTLHSDERQILDAEREYWRPRVAVHFGGKLLRWALLDFGQGTPRVLVVLNPTARKQTFVLSICAPEFVNSVSARAKSPAS